MERIHRFGPLSFEEYLELALYDEDDGFYSAGGAAGRRGDFLTSPEVGPLFGAVLAAALDRWWDDLGRPDPFVVIEAAAGTGVLAAAVLAAGPACAPALRYVLVERSELLRDQAASRVPLEQPAFVLGPTTAPGPDDEIEVIPGSGPMATALAELPAEPVQGVVIANELLDNLPFSLLERADDGWCEVRVGEAGGTLVEVVVPAPAELAALAEVLAPGAPAGGRIPVQRQARAWVGAAIGALQRGRVVAIDYADTTASMASRPPTAWLRTYRGHAPGGHPLDRPGTQDVTTDVAVDQLPAPAADSAQADFLRQHGLDRLVGAARAQWQERAAVGDLEALKAKSRVSEAAALTDPSGLGAFRVLEWLVP